MTEDPSKFRKKKRQVSRSFTPFRTNCSFKCMDQKRFFDVSKTRKSWTKVSVRYDTESVTHHRGAFWTRKMKTSCFWSIWNCILPPLVYNWLVVEPTHLKNMFVKLDHLPYGKGENKKYLSCHHLDKIVIHSVLFQKNWVPFFSQAVLFGKVATESIRQVKTPTWSLHHPQHYSQYET